jgi:hypothetical protein
MINKKESVFNGDMIRFFLLLVFSVTIVYFTPVILSRIFFLILLLFIFISKKDYFWVAFLFVLNDAPGRLFSNFDNPDAMDYTTVAKSLPFFEFGGMRVSFLDLFMLVLLLKVLIGGRPNHFIFKNDFKFLLVFFIIVILYSFVFKIEVTNLVYTIRKVLPWILIIFIPKKFAFGDFIKFDRLIFPFVFLAFASQVYTFITGHYLIDFFTGGISVRADALEWSEEGGYRAGDSAFILFYCLHKGFFYFFSKEKKFSDKYTTLVILLSVLSIFLTATRGWIIAVVVVTLLTLYQNSNRVNILRILSILLSGILFVFILFLVFPGFDKQSEFVINRVYTISAIAEGDLSAGGTLSRLTDRAPAVMGVWVQSPLFGYGFSRIFYRYADIHVGQPTMLLNVGIFGFLIFTFIFFKWLYILVKWAKNKMIQATYGNAALVFSSSLIFIYILHSSSQTAWGFYITVEQTTISICLLLTSFSAIVQQQTKLIKPKVNFSDNNIYQI